MDSAQSVQRSYECNTMNELEDCSISDTTNESKNLAWACPGNGRR